MRWRVDFYNARRGIVARYWVEALLPAAAVALGEKAVLAEYPPVRVRRRRLSLFERAERVAADDGSGWILYRIMRDDGQGSAPVPSVSTERASLRTVMA